MDSLSFDDLVPQNDTSASADTETSLGFDDLVPTSESKTVGAGQAAANAAVRGGLNLRSNANTMAAESLQGLAEDSNRSFGEIVEDSDDTTPGFKPYNPRAAGSGIKTGSKDYVPEVEGLWRWATSRLANMAGYDADALSSSAEARLKSALEDRLASAKLPRSAAAQRFVDAKQRGDISSAQGMLDFTWNDPAAVAAMAGETSIESAPSMAAGIAAGAITRNPGAAALAMGGSSYFQERYGTVLDFLADNGVDLNNPEAAKSAISNRELMAKADEMGIKRGAIVAAFDTISGIFAGGALAKGPIANFAGQMVGQATLGGAGEAAAQKATTGKIDWSDVALEALAEFTTAPIEVVGVGRQYLSEKGKSTSDINVEEVLGDVAAGKAGAREVLLAHGMTADQIDDMVKRRAPAGDAKIEQTPEAGANAAEAAAINATQDQQTPKVSAIVERAKQMAEQRAAQERAATSAGNSAASPASQQAAENTQPPAMSPSAAPASESPEAGVVADPATPANSEITENVPEVPGEATFEVTPEKPKDELFERATEMVRSYNNASLGFLMGRMKLSEKKARRLQFDLEDAGVISKPNERGLRTVVRDNLDTNTVPETDATIAAQQQALVEGKRRAVFYPEGTKPAAKPVGGNIKRIKVEGTGIFDYDTAQVTPQQIREASKAGLLNSLLDMGPVNKEQVAESAAAGDTPVAVVERTPEGTEVKAAAGTDATAPEQVAALEETKAAEENTVAVEDPREVVAQRRVLQDQSAESQYARELQAEANEPVKARVKKAAKEIRTGQVYEEAKPKGKNRTKAEKQARTETNTRADQLFASTAPSDAERAIEFGFQDQNVVTRNKARAAIRERARAMIVTARAAGLKLPAKVSDNTDETMNLSDGAIAAVMARDFLAALKNPDPNKSTEEIYSDFLTDDMLLRSGSRDTVLGKRRADNDTRTQGDTEGAIDATPAEASTPEETVAAKEEGDEVAAEALKREFGANYTAANKGTAGVTVQTKKRRTITRMRGKKARTVPIRPLEKSDILETYTLAQAFDRIGPTPGRQMNRTIIDGILSRMLKKIGSAKVRVVDPDALDAMYPELGRGGVDGYYDPETGEIVISAVFLRNGEFDAQLIAHEGVHAYLEAAIESDKGLKEDIREILVYAKSKSANPSAYGFTNPHEFLSEALSNPAFQDELAALPVSAKLASKFDMPKTGSVWMTFIHAIKRHFKMGNNAVDALSYVIRLAERAENNRERIQQFTREARQLGLLSTGRQQRDYAKELTDAGVPADAAAELAEFIESGMAGVLPKDLDAFLQDLIKEFGKPTSGSKKTSKEAKAEVDKQAKKIIRKAEKSAQELADEAYLKALDEFKPGRTPGKPRLLSLLMNNQLALISDKYFGRDTNPVRRVVDIVEKRRTQKARHLERLAPVPEELYEAEQEYMATKEGRKQWEAFVTLAHDATMAQVHPDLPLDDEAHKHLGKESMNGMWGKEQHPKLAARFAALPDDLKALYAKTRDVLTETQNEIGMGKIYTILEAVGQPDMELAKRFFEGKATEADRARVDEIVAQHIEHAGELTKLAGPYFNLVRRGDWVVQGTYDVTVPSNGKKISDNVIEFKTKDEAIAYAKGQELRPTINRVVIDEKTGESIVTDDDGTEVLVSINDPNAVERFRVTVQNKHVEFFHTETEAKTAALELKKAGLRMKDVEAKTFERNAANGDMLSDQMRALAATLEKQQAYSRLSDAQKQQLRNTLNEASLRFLGSTRIQSSRLPRRYVQGASKDLVLNTFDYIDSASGYLAKIDTQLELETAMRQMDKAVKSLSARGQGLGTGGSLVKNEVERRVLNVDYDLDKGLLAAASNRLMVVNFVNHLASPFYSVLQTMQVGMLTLPKMAAEYGELSASGALAKAYWDVGAGRTALKGALNTAKAVGAVTTPGKTYVDDIKASLKDADEKRLIDELIAKGVVDADSGFEVNRLTRKGNPVLRGLDTGLDYFASIARQAPQAIEAINRTVTALATFRLEMAKHGNYEKAVRAAQEMVEMTQFNLSASNAAPIFQNPLGRLLLQFKKYGQNVYFLLGRELGRSIRPMEKGDRVKAVKSLAYLLATHQVMAGMMGLPWEPAKVGLMLLNGLGTTEIEWSDFENMIGDYVRELLGDDDDDDDDATDKIMYGLPRTLNMNLTTRVGLSDLLLFGEPRDMQKAESFKSWLFDLAAGPSSGSIKDTISGIRSIGSGDFVEGFEKLMPVKAIGDAVRAARELDEGKFDVSDAVMRAIGVQSARQARIQDTRSDTINAREKIKRQRAEIINDWLSASNAGERRKLVSRMREYNRQAGKRDQLSIRFLENIRRRDAAQYGE